MTNMIFPAPINNEVPYGTPNSVPVMQMSHPADQRIQTIKAMRNEFDWGLRQAKNFVEYGLRVESNADFHRIGMLQCRVASAMKLEGLSAPTFRWVGQKVRNYVAEPVSFESDDAYSSNVKCPT